MPLPISLRFVVTNEPLCFKSVQVAAIRIYDVDTLLVKVCRFE